MVTPRPHMFLSKTGSMVKCKNKFICLSLVTVHLNILPIKENVTWNKNYFEKRENIHVRQWNLVNIDWCSTRPAGHTDTKADKRDEVLRTIHRPRWRKTSIDQGSTYELRGRVFDYENTHNCFSFPISIMIMIIQWFLLYIVNMSWGKRSSC